MSGSRQYFQAVGGRVFISVGGIYETELSSGGGIFAIGLFCH